MKDNSREVSSSSTHTTRFTCAYCNNIINRSDTQCPYCGAETASSIKKYMEIKKAEAEQCNTRINSLDKKRTYSIIGLVCALLAVVILSVLLSFSVIPILLPFYTFLLSLPGPGGIPGYIF